MSKSIEEPKETCGDCRYYLSYARDDEDEEEVLTDDDYTGVCRRYPPKLFLLYPDSMSVYPDVIAATGWCGEFTPKL